MAGDGGPPAHDSTHRLRLHNRVLKRLAIAQAAHLGDLGEQLRRITEAASEILEVERASIWIYGGNRSRIRALDMYERGPNRHSSGTELLAAHYAEYFSALETERVIIAHDACTDSATRCFADSYLRPFGISSMLDAPIRVAGQAVGVLCHEHVGPKRLWTEEDEIVAANLADFVSLALETHERRQAEEALRQSRAQLNHAQKMEAIGRFAGGVAHDFNNLVTAILGAADLLRHRLPAEDKPLHEDLDEIVRAAQRAADLTQKLLAVTRRQAIETRVIDPNAVVGEMLGMLVRLLGEEWRLDAALAPDAGRVLADRGQLEQVLLNLVVNARDAMPLGGTIHVRTRNESGGPWEAVVLEVEDTGLGMTPEVQARMFDPFFTTKETGLGTGLGLSTVWGIVEQSGGEVRVRSAPREGTTVTVRLPRHLSAAAAPPEPRPAVPAGVPKGDETILIVEDDEQLRTLARIGLTRLGYTVLLAKDVDEAVDRCDEHQGPIHLLVSDVVMPKASGPLVAERVRSMRPEAAVLFVSGYPEEALARYGGDTAGQLLRKPYTPRQMAARIRQVLDARKKG